MSGIEVDRRSSRARRRAGAENSMAGLLRKRLRGLVHLLAADQSSCITGQLWAVNGGMDT
jgi:hypothetical protein